MNESIHTIEKLIKVAKKVQFEYERHIELIIEFVRQVGEAGALIKDKNGLITNWKKVENLEEYNYQSEAVVANQCKI